MNFESIKPININKAFIIHFKDKSTEEFVNKIKRGYSNWFNDKLTKFNLDNIRFYLKHNNATLEKINYIEKNLNINLANYKKVHQLLKDKKNIPHKKYKSNRIS